MTLSQYESFLKKIEKVASHFRTTSEGKSIRIVSHLDADGITSAAILIKAFSRLGLISNYEIIQQISKEYILKLKEASEEILIFSDLGSNQVQNIQEIINDKIIFILDHHAPKAECGHDLTHVNPHEFGIDGSKEICGSGVVYFFAKYLDQQNLDLAYLAIIGSIGDVQENDGFIGLNKIILDDAVKSSKIEILQGPRIFGIQTRPLYRVLSHSNDFKIPTISCDDDKAIEFLQNIGIEYKLANDQLLRFNDMNIEKKAKLNIALINDRKFEKNPQEIIGNIYRIHGEPCGPTMDAKEFSTLLNSCGRMNRPDIGIGVCLGDAKKRQESLNLKNDYSNEISSLLRWFDTNLEDKSKIIVTQKYVIINARNELSPTTIGTLASILAKNGRFKEDMVIISMARNTDDTTKVSGRVTGLHPKSSISIKDIFESVVLTVGGETGGHQYACGALIKSDDEDKFIEVLISKF